MPAKVKIIFGIIALAALVSGIIVSAYLTKEKTSTAVSKPIKQQSIVGSKRIEFSLEDTDGKLRSLSEWDGKVIMINFWATWCPPCRREIPAFIEVQEKYHDKGFVIIGVALDTRQAAIDFIDPMGINYPVLVGEEEGINLNLRYGNHLGVLPYTVIIDKQGIIRHALLHEITRDDVIKMITPLL